MSLTNFIVISLVFALLAYVAKRYIPESLIATVVAVVIILVWIFKYLLPFLGVSL